MTPYPCFQTGMSLYYVDILIARMHLTADKIPIDHVLIPDHRGEVNLGSDGCHSYPHAHASADRADHFE